MRKEKLNRELGFIDAGVDGIIIADDIAHQRGLMVSLATLREYLFPSLARQVELIRRHLPAFFHSDGQYAEVISDLINCGFQGLQCLEGGAGMDPLKLKSLHLQLCLWGTLEIPIFSRRAILTIWRNFFQNHCSRLPNRIHPGHHLSPF